MKFDFVVGNPPYQDSSHTEKKNTLWRKFVSLSLDIVKDNGYVTFIIPSSWMGSKKILDESFLGQNLLFVNKDECKKHFPGVGSTFSYYVLQKSQYGGNTTIINKEISGKINNQNLNINDVIIDCFPRNLMPESISVINKVLNGGHQKLGVVNNTTHHSVHRNRWRLEKDIDHPYPIQNTPGKLYWWNSPHKDQGKIKLIIPTTTYFRKMMITEYGVTQSFCYYLLADTEDADIVLNNTNNIVFDYINECFRYSNWNSVPLLRKLPRIPFDKKMSDQEIFDFFNLSADEIKVVKEAITWR